LKSWIDKLLIHKIEQIDKILCIIKKINIYIENWYNFTLFIYLYIYIFIYLYIYIYLYINVLNLINKK